MSKIKEILRLHYESSLSHRSISASLEVSRSTVTNVLRRAEAAELSWPLPTDLQDEEQLEHLLYPAATGRPRKIAEPDWNHIYQELHRKGVTLQLLWIEYRQENTDGYQYSQFCERYRKWKEKLDVSMHQHHRGGEKLFVDYAGPTVQLIDPDTGEVQEAQIFVAVLGASNYTYIEAHRAQDLESFIHGHVNAFAYFGGTPAVIVPDNLKSAVTQADRYEPVINRSYLEMARHYGCAVVPARPRRPKDKPKAEVGVQIVERTILAPLRNRKFFSLGELNETISEALESLNHKPFQKLEGTRASLFAAVDKPALRKLPTIPYEFARWTQARVAPDYHIEVEKTFYSVPYALVHEYVDVRITNQIVEVFLRGKRVACHVRGKRKYQYVTEPAHMPEAHREHLEWTPEKFMKWGRSIGPYAAIVVEQIMAKKAHPEQAYRSCLGLLSLGRRYAKDRIESACAHAVSISACTYRSVKSILETGVDQITLSLGEEDKPTPLHKNVRGASYYGPGTGKLN